MTFFIIAVYMVIQIALLVLSWIAPTHQQCSPSYSIQMCVPTRILYMYIHACCIVLFLIFVLCSVQTSLQDSGLSKGSYDPVSRQRPLSLLLSCPSAQPPSPHAHTCHCSRDRGEGSCVLETSTKSSGQITGIHV